MNPRKSNHASNWKGLCAQSCVWLDQYPPQWAHKQPTCRITSFLSHSVCHYYTLPLLVPAVVLTTVMMHTATCFTSLYTVTSVTVLCHCHQQPLIQCLSLHYYALPLLVPTSVLSTTAAIDMYLSHQLSGSALLRCRHWNSYLSHRSVCCCCLCQCALSRSLVSADAVRIMILCHC